MCSMSSSHRKKAPTSELLPCPECGEAEVVRTVERCQLADGLRIKSLGYFKCRSCGARLFDDDAIHVIQTERASQSARSMG
jgi:predicted RNA-binding Zn-ribbon protein involved in translation (DUF1610 family)